MIDWLFGTVLGKCVMTFLISLLPVVELRGGIPYGISQGLDPWLAFAASTLGNMLPVPFLLLFVRKILHWMKRYPRLGRLAISLERRADRKSSRVRKSELVGLCILVAIPLPGTGAWTGALVAALMEMRLKRALPAIYAGVLIAGLLVTPRPDRRKALSRLTRPKGAAMKRTDYISWDEYFMGVALLAARRSKDPNTQVGACIVSPENIILSTGYNGLPCRCSDDVFPWEREGAETKYPYVVHAELNAILNAGGRVLRGARLYVALFPCNECAKAIIQSGIREIIYFSDKYAETANIRASKRMLDAAGVRYHPLQTELASITLDFRAPESAEMPQKSGASKK